MHRVEVRDVDSPMVRLGRLVTVLVHVHPEEDHVHAVDLLEENDALGRDGELAWEALIFVPFIHARPHVVLLVLNVRHLLDMDHVDLRRCIEISGITALLQLSFLELVRILATHAVLEELGEKRVRNVFGTLNVYSGLFLLKLGPLLFDAEGAVVHRRRDLVLAPVEERADLVHPALADRALDPRLLMLLVVLLARKITLMKRAVGHLDRLLILELAVAHVAPMVLVLAACVVVRVAPNPLSVARRAVTVVYRGLVHELLREAQSAGLAIFLALFLILQRLHRLLPVQIELLFHRLGYLSHLRCGAVVPDGVVECQAHLGRELLDVAVLPVLKFLAYRPEVHGLRDRLVIIGELQLDWIYGLVENPSVFVVHKLLEHGRAALPDHGRLEIGWLRERSNVLADLLDRERVDERRRLVGFVTCGRLLVR
mmetsp:Transcript_96068/g.273855  ORF Transcript_96068/g.273855 Transcript_96068/m.273855 type:complete len:427 (-) Transcript_96068:254-1534(-)